MIASSKENIHVINYKHAFLIIVFFPFLKLINEVTICKIEFHICSVLYHKPELLNYQKPMTQ